MVREGPVPVRLCPLVAALVTQRLLVQVDVIAVEAEKEAVAVDEGSLLDVHTQKVIVARTRTGNLGEWCDVGQVCEAVYRVDIAQPIRLGESTPERLQSEQLDLSQS